MVPGPLLKGIRTIQDDIPLQPCIHLKLWSVSTGMYLTMHIKSKGQGVRFLCRHRPETKIIDNGMNGRPDHQEPVVRYESALLKQKQLEDTYVCDFLQVIRERIDDHSGNFIHPCVGFS
jgi:hypothetical protein